MTHKYGKKLKNLTSSYVIQRKSHINFLLERFNMKGNCIIIDHLMCHNHYKIKHVKCATHIAGMKSRKFDIEINLKEYTII